MIELSLLLSPKARYVVFTCISKPNAPLSETKEAGLLGLFFNKLWSGCRIIRVWDLNTMKELPTIDPQKLISSMIFSQKDNWLVTAAHTVQIWALQSGRCIYEFAGHTYGVGAVAISSDNKLLASFGHRTNTLRIWDVRQHHFWENQEARCLYILRNIPVRILRMTFSVNEQYLLCDISKGGRIIFEIQRNDKGVQLVLISCDANLNLIASGAKLDSAVGLSGENLQLLRQRGAKGTPSTTATIEAIAKFGLMKAEDVDSLNDKVFDFSKPIIRGSTYSVLDPDLLIHFKQGVVSLVRDEQSEAPRHAFIVIELVNALGHYVCMRADLTNWKAPAGKARVIMDDNKNNSVRVKDRIRQKNELLLLIRPRTKKSEKNIKGVFGFSWLVSRQKILAMRENIKEDEKYGVRQFSSLGSRSIFSVDSADNCFTWARKKLLTLGEPRITKNLPKSIFEFVVTNPSFKLTVAPDAEYQLRMHC